MYSTFSHGSEGMSDIYEKTNALQYSTFHMVVKVLKCLEVRFIGCDTAHLRMVVKVSMYLRHR